MEIYVFFVDVYQCNILGVLYEWKISTAHPILTIMFKNILRTFEAEILIIFKNTSLIPKSIRCYEKECMLGQKTSNK